MEFTRMLFPGSCVNEAYSRFSEELPKSTLGGLCPGVRKTSKPDGIKVDRNGNLLVTGPKGIWVWAANGNHLGTIVMPEQPANLNWGDKDYRTLYITATNSVYRLEMKTRGFVPYL